MNLYSIRSSSMPSQYVDNNSGDVVIMVPSIEPDQNDSMVVRSLGEQSVCIDTEDVDIEPISPKTMTESSSKSKSIIFYSRSASDVIYVVRERGEHTI